MLDKPLYQVGDAVDAAVGKDLRASNALRRCQWPEAPRLSSKLIVAKRINGKPDNAALFAAADDERVVYRSQAAKLLDRLHRQTMGRRDPASEHTIAIHLAPVLPHADQFARCGGPRAGQRRRTTQRGRRLAT